MNAYQEQPATCEEDTYELTGSNSTKYRSSSTTLHIICRVKLNQYRLNSTTLHINVFRKNEDNSQATGHRQWSKICQQHIANIKKNNRDKVSMHRTATLIAACIWNHLDCKLKHKTVAHFKLQVADKWRTG